MYNIDQEVYVKGIITGISKEDDGSFEYKVTIKSTLYSRGEEVRVAEDQIRTVAVNPVTMDELEKRCR